MEGQFSRKLLSPNDRFWPKADIGQAPDSAHIGGGHASNSSHLCIKNIRQLFKNLTTRGFNSAEHSSGNQCPQLGKTWPCTLVAYSFI
jgi:hypothetical protein